MNARTDYQRLKEARIAAGYKLRGIALEVGVSYEAIRKYEKGMLEPSDKVLRRICGVLGLEVNEIVMVKEK